MKTMLRNLFVAILLVACVAGCSSTSGLVLYQQEYSASPTFRNKADTEILAFRLGAPGEGGYAQDIATYEYSKERIPQYGGVTRYQNVFGSIWVKWKSKSDGHVQEALAEFGDRLPRDSKASDLFFTTYSNRLFVYPVTTEPGKSLTDSDHMPPQAEQFKTIELFRSK